MLRVRDIMQTDVATASPEMTVRELARLWEEHGISGTPVCDASGKVLGVVSATDLVRLAAEGVDASDVAAREVDYPPEEVEEDAPEAAWYYYLASEAPELYGGRDGITETAFEEATVGEIMTRAIFSVRANATVAELARFLLRAGIHRALVMEGGKLIGIVTASDVLRVVAGEVDGAAAGLAVGS
ncbi:MAG TPA: CBS domain-containing protein [Longimicrobiales bacterium]